MVPSRKDTIDAIVQALQPSNLPLTDLTAKIAELLEIKADVDGELDSFEAETKPKLGRKQLRRNYPGVFHGVTPFRRSRSSGSC